MKLDPPHRTFPMQNCTAHWSSLSNPSASESSASRSSTSSSWASTHQRLPQGNAAFASTLHGSLGSMGKRRRAKMPSGPHSPCS